MALLTGLLIFISVYTFEKIEPIKTGEELAFFSVKTYERKEKIIRKPTKGGKIAGAKVKPNENDVPATTKQRKPKAKKLYLNTNSNWGSTVRGFKEFINLIMSFEEPKFIVIVLIVAHILYLIACIFLCIGIWKVYLIKL